MNRGLRIAALFLSTCFALTACGGGGGGRSFLGGGGSTGTGAPSGASGGKGNVQFTLTIPSAGSSTTSSTVRKPKTISSSTESITVSVNGGTPQIFNTSSCSGSPNLTCVLSIGANYGLDSFLILTWSGPNGTGTELNAAAVTINVSSGGPNTASATAGNVITVNSSADGSGGSFSCAGGSTTCTLREAVAEASTTAGVFTALLFSGVSAITLTAQAGPITINGQSIIIIGPGAMAANTNAVGAPSASANLTVSGGGSTQILWVEAGSLLVDGITLSNGNSTDNSGGAIENDGALSIVNTIFSGNNGANTQNGGAVYDEGSVPSTIASSTFTNNGAQYHGGAYYDDAGASFSRTLFNGNVAFSGSGFTSGGAIYAEGNLAVDSSTFTANVAGSESASGLSGEGGAISIVGATVNPSITNSTFGGSTAAAGNFAGGTGSGDDGYGGAIYNGGPSSLPLTFSGNTFSNNIAKGGDEATGGAIWDDRGITSTGDTFTSNVADGTAATSSSDAYAGAIYDSAPISFTGATFNSNQVLGGTSPYGEAGGGAIYADGFLSATQTTFSSNATSAAEDAYGGGVYDDDDNGDTIAFSNVQFLNNTVTASVPSSPQTNPYATGGALEIDYAAISMQTVTISGNTATANGNATYPGYAYGGGFEYYDGDTGDGCGDNPCSVARNPAPTSNRATPSSVSAAAAGVAKRAALMASVKTRRSNAVARLQALASTRVSKKARHAATISVARLAAARKVQVVSNGSGNALDTVSFMNNTASGGPSGWAYGGGAEFSGNPTTNAVTFTGNVATVSGTGGSGVGGAFTYGNVENCESFTFTGSATQNTATNQGGAIWNTCGMVTVMNSTISGNSVTAIASTGDGGGGVWSRACLAIVQSTVTGNSVAGSATSAGGGGLLSYDDTTANVVNSTIYNNTSSVDGGGIENANGSQIFLTNATVYQNKATGNGGNVSNDLASDSPGSTWVYSANTIIAGGTAANGSDIWNLDEFWSYGYNLVQQSSTFGSGTSNAANGVNGDMIGSNPALASGLASNGGPTQTIADTASSPGVGVIPFVGTKGSGTCNSIGGTTTDQRGYLRGNNGFCDIGAFELSGTATTQSTARSTTSYIKARIAH